MLIVCIYNFESVTFENNKQKKKGKGSLKDKISNNDSTPVNIPIA